MRLADVHSPQDLRGLSVAELESLGSEIREVILQTVARTGGHLAPNLGVVELTLALHTVFSSPQDKLLWDVSHQSYVHKLLTGRLDRFATLRQREGIAGFTDPHESEHDHWHWGHASTSISAAMGMAKARDLGRQKHHVVAVIGDGALTGGMAFEALDHLGHDKTRVIVVLNDNSMSIAANVGGLSQYLARIRTGPSYQWLKQQTAQVLKQIPLVGDSMLGSLDRMKEGLKHLMVPNMFFEDLGLTYLGPVNGHDLPALQETLRQAREYPGPTVVHVVTTKGKGVVYAEELPDKFHGGGPFDVATGKMKPGSLTYSEMVGQTLSRLAQLDDRVVALTAAMPSGTGLTGFAKAHPQRFFDVGIAEQHATTLAAGMAKGGLRPIFCVYSTFLQRAYDQTIHDVALQGLPVLYVIDRAGLVEDGATHQGVYDIAYLRCVPGLTLMAPKDENEIQHMVATGLSLAGPAALRIPRGKAQGVALDGEPKALPVGKGEVLRDGSDVLLLGLGTLAPVALQAADLLAAEGIDAAVINPRFIKPLDAALIERYARTCAAVVTAEEGALMGGFGSAVLEHLQAAGLGGVAVERLGVPDAFVPHGNPSFYLEQFGLTPAGIAAAARRALLRNSTVAVSNVGSTLGSTPGAAGAHTLSRALRKAAGLRLSSKARRMAGGTDVG